MPVSEVQLEVWRVRRKLDRKLAKMTPEERTEYVNGALAGAEAKTGIDLDTRPLGAADPLVDD